MHDCNNGSCRICFDSVIDDDNSDFEYDEMVDNEL